VTYGTSAGSVGWRRLRRSQASAVAAELGVAGSAPHTSARRRARRGAPARERLGRIAPLAEECARGPIVGSGAGRTCRARAGCVLTPSGIDAVVGLVHHRQVVWKQLSARSYMRRMRLDDDASS